MFLEIILVIVIDNPFNRLLNLKMRKEKVPIRRSNGFPSKVQEQNSRTEAPFPIFNSNIFQFGKSSIIC